MACEEQTDCTVSEFLGHVVRLLGDYWFFMAAAMDITIRLFLVMSERKWWRLGGRDG